MKIQLILSLMFFSGSIFNCTAQFNLTWNSNYSHTVSPNFSNESRKVVKDANNNTYVLADVTSDIDPNGIPGAITYHYTALLKYNAAGTLVTSKVINVNTHTTTGFNNKSGFGLEMDSNGFLYVGFNSYDPTSNYNVNITKYRTSTMTRLWIWGFNPGSVDRGIELKVGASGTAYGIVQSVTGSNTRYHIVKADTSGNSTSSFYAFDQNADVLNSMVVDASNNVFVTGYRLISSIKNALIASVKYSGTLKWKKTYNGGTSNRDDYGKYIVYGTNAKLFVCGTSDRGNPSLNDVMVLSYDAADGKFNWVSYLDYFLSNDSGVMLKQADVNNLYIGSVSSNTIVISRVETANGNYSGKGIYNPIPISPHASIDGVNLSQLLISSAKNCYISGTVYATDISGLAFSGTFLAKFRPVTTRTTGSSAFNFDFGLPVEGNASLSYVSSDILLNPNTSSVYALRDKIQTNQNHSMEVIQLSRFSVPSPNRIMEENIDHPEQSLTVYPNPVEDILYMNSKIPLTNLELRNAEGKLVREIKLKEADEFNLNISEFPAGIYLLSLQNASGEFQTRKIFIK